MKKRIISLILVVVMSLLTLSGCAYSYAKDKMENYADFNSAAFLAALQKLDIEAGDFGTDEETRWVKVQDAIITTLASKAADKTNKINEGKVGAYDILYYSYFYTVTVGENTFYFDTNKLTEASSNVQFGLSANKEGTLAGALQQEFVGKDFVKDNEETADVNEGNYYVVSTAKVEPKEGKFVGVNVTYKVTEKDAEGNEKPAKTHTNEIVYVPHVAEGETIDSLEKYLFGKSNGAIEDFTLTDDNGTKVYSAITINFSLNWAGDNDDGNSFAPIVIGDDEGEEIKYEKKSTDKDDTKVTDAFGNTTTAGELNGKNKVYYIFPVYFVDVEEDLSVETLLYKVFGESLTSTSLEIFTSEDYKNGDDKISALITALTAKIKEYNTAEKTKTTAETTYGNKLTALKNAITGEGAADKKTKLEDLAKAAVEAYDAKKAATSENKETLEKAYTDAKKALDDYIKDNVTDATKKSEFNTAYDARITAIEKFEAADKARTEAKDKVLGCLENKEEMADKIIEAYRESQYDSLEATYRSEITEAVADEIMHLAQEYITYKGYPKKALKEAIKRVENELKYNFYTGTYSGSDTSLKGQTNYVAFGGSYDKFVKSVSELGLNADSTKTDIDAAIEAKAKASIEDVILVYVLVDCLNANGVEIALTKEEKKEIKTLARNNSNVQKSDIETAYLFDKVIEHFMELEDRGEAPEKVEKPAEGTSEAYDAYLAAMKKYNTVAFKNVKIAEDAE